MRHLVVIAVIIAVLLASAVVVGRAGGTTAQEGTPDPVLQGPPAGVHYEPLAVGAVPAPPPSPAALVIIELRLEPGAVFALPPDDPGTTLYTVRTGTLTARLTASMVATRAGEITPEEEASAIARVDPGAPLHHAFAAGTAFPVGPDDSFVVLPRTGGEVRNDGAERVVVLAASIFPDDPH